MKAGFIILVVSHGLLHLIGFSRAFFPRSFGGSSQSISKKNGILWLIAAVLFLGAVLLLLTQSDFWWLSAAIGVIMSQYVIITSWTEAKYGTVANVIIFFVAIIGFGTWKFSHNYKNEVAQCLQEDKGNVELLTDADTKDLPPIVRQYLYFTGSVNKPKVKNFSVAFRGSIRYDNNSDWMPFTSEQYNFIGSSTRLFFMNATMKSLPVAGFHSFKGGDAFMDIRLLSLFRVQYESGSEMSISETVTFFNDMCCMAPATLIDRRITWEEADSNTVTALFTNNGITIKAWLYFNEYGQLVNFVSNDRFATTPTGMKKMRWSTPLKDYRYFNGYLLASYADAIYQYSTGDLWYGNFRTQSITYNTR